MNIQQHIDPNLFKPAYRKVAYPNHPKFYLATLTLQGVHYPLRGTFKRASDAQDRAQRVHARWLRLFAAIPAPAEA